LPGFAVVALEPDESDARPFGIGNLPQAYTNDQPIVEIELYMPDTPSALVTSCYSVVKERRIVKKLSILARQISCHSFELEGAKLPMWVQKDVAKDFKKQLKRYGKKHSI